MCQDEAGSLSENSSLPSHGHVHVYVHTWMCTTTFALVQGPDLFWKVAIMKAVHFC